MNKTFHNGTWTLLQTDLISRFLPLTEKQVRNARWASSRNTWKLTFNSYLSINNSRVSRTALSPLKSKITSLPEGGNWDSDSFSIGLLQLSHLSCLFDTEMDFVAVLSNNLQLDVFGIFAHFLWFLNANSSEVMSDQDGDLKESASRLLIKLERQISKGL